MAKIFTPSNGVQQRATSQHGLRWSLRRRTRTRSRTSVEPGHGEGTWVPRESSTAHGCRTQDAQDGRTVDRSRRVRDAGPGGIGCTEPYRPYGLDKILYYQYHALPTWPETHYSIRLHSDSRATTDRSRCTFSLRHLTAAVRVCRARELTQHSNTHIATAKNVVPTCTSAEELRALHSTPHTLRCI